MGYLGKLFHQIINLGIDKKLDNRERTTVKLSNIFCLIILSGLLVVSALEIIYSLDDLFYDLSFIVFFLVPLYLNFRKKYQISRILILGFLLSATIIGTFFMQFGEGFQFTIIIPLSLYFIFYQDINNWVFYTLVSLSGIFVILAIGFEIYTEQIAHMSSIIDLGISMMTVTVFVFVLVFFVKRVNRSQKELEHRLKYEKAIADFSQIIFGKGDEYMCLALDTVLKATEASRIYIFENTPDNQLSSQIYEVCAPGINAELKNPSLQNLSLEKAGFIRWIRHFQAGQIITGFTEELPPAEKAFLEKQHILSVLAIPIFSKNKWSGFIGFDDVLKERIWQENDINLLKTLADMIGPYFEANRYKRKITQQNEELIQLNATKDRFFSIVAHDLKNPFTSLIGFSNLLEEELRESEKPSIDLVKNYADYINKGLLRTFDYLSNLLEWSRLQIDGIKFTPSPIILHQIVEEARSLVLIQAQTKNIAIKVAVPDEISLIADKNMLKTVLVNLVSNAIKYSKQGDEVLIQGVLTESHAQISVIDNGVGIDPEKRDGLFSVKNASSTPGTNNETGTGLGLILCKEFIHLHKGEIRVESEENKGSAFSFTLPFSQN